MRRAFLNEHCMFGDQCEQCQQSVIPRRRSHDKEACEALRKQPGYRGLTITRLPKQVLHWSAGGGNKSGLRKYRHIADERDFDEAEPLEALILFPGESAIVMADIESDAHGLQSNSQEAPTVWFDHPDVCAAMSQTCSEPKKDSRIDRRYFTISLVRQFPLVIELQTQFKFIMPGLPTTKIRARASGYRDRFPQVPYK